jgi:hypothetical protein
VLALQGSRQQAVGGAVQGAEDAVHRGAGAEGADPADGGHHAVRAAHSATGMRTALLNVAQVQSLACLPLTTPLLSPSQRDSAGLATQNNELKFRLQAMEQQAQLRDGEKRIPLSWVG